MANHGGITESAPLQYRIGAVVVRCQLIGFCIASRLSMAVLIAALIKLVGSLLSLLAAATSWL